MRWVWLIVVMAVARVEAAERKPNVVLIVTDDQGWGDAGCYGAKDLETPNIDALAKSGVRFTQFYAAAPVCSPSRASILTGRYPQRFGLIGNAASQKGKEGGLPGNEATMAEMFRAADYATGHFGKWHLGYTPDQMPNAQGFDYSFGHMGGCIDNYSHFFFWSGPNVHDLYRNGQEVHHDGQFFPDLLVREASAFMERNRERPFFLYFAINLPHYPYQGDEKWLRHYHALPYPRNLYAAFVSTMDERIGVLLKKMAGLKLRERTIVIFQSDNGYSVEDRAHFGGGSAGPYRGAKFSLFEGGIRVPAVISWPGKLPENAVRNQMAFGCDWLPTLAELCEVKAPQTALDGKSLTAVIRDNEHPSPHHILHWETGTARNPSWAVREGPWKFLGKPLDNTGAKLGTKDKESFLANLDNDAGEVTNVAAQFPEIAERLRKAHEEWLRQTSGSAGR
jgi:arylsulfatase A